MSNTLLLVLGPPSGGTSAVAGVLHHLGMDMGKDVATARNPVRPRAYPNYECRKYVAMAGRSTSPVQYQQGTRDYIADRLAGPSDCNGLKYPFIVLYLVRMPGLASLPIRTLLVERPFADVLRSNLRYYRKLNRKNEWMLARGGSLGRLLMSQSLVCETRPPIGKVDYYKLLNHTEDTVREIATITGMVPTDEQLQAAIDFVDTSMRHV